MSARPDDEPSQPKGNSRAESALWLPNTAETARWSRQIAADLEGRYEVLGFLGQGGFATVWHGRDRVTGEAVAIKRFEPTSRRRRDFYLEMSTLFRLRHPRIVGIVNLREVAGGARYLMLEFCPGGNLRAALEEARRTGCRPTPSRLRSLAMQIAEGLSAAHRQGLVHRDLKPENLLFDRAEPSVLAGEAAIKLADFGLARLLRHVSQPADQDGRLRALSGSPTYMAPEQFCERAGRSSDIYAIGIILYELWHGAPPFSGTPGDLAQQHLREMPRIGKHVPAGWRDLLQHLLAKQPEARPSADELLGSLARLSEAAQATVSSPPPARVDAATFYEERCLGVPAFELFWQKLGGETQVVAVAKEGLFRFRADDGRPRGVTIQPGIMATAQDESGRIWIIQDGRIWRQDSHDRFVALRHLAGTFDRLAVWAGQRGTATVAAQNSDGIMVKRLAFDATQTTWALTAQPCRFLSLLGFLPDGSMLVEHADAHNVLRRFSPEGSLLGRVILPGACRQYAVGQTADDLYLLLDSEKGKTLARVTWGQQRWQAVDVPVPLTRLARTLAGFPCLWAVASDGSAWRRTSRGAWQRLDHWGDVSDALQVAGDGSAFAALVEKDGSRWIRFLADAAS